MAAKSKTQIIANIDKRIITNGDIKAVDTNTILKDILDCKELNGPSNVSTFSFKSETAIKDDRGATLNYSLRGVRKSFVNITFRIAITETSVNDLVFEHKIPEAIVKDLEEIMNTDLGNEIDFLVKIENKQSPVKKPFVVGSLNFTYTNKTFDIRIDSQEPEPNSHLFNGDQIFTSFAVHCPDKF